MGAVDVADNVHLDGGIDGDDAKAADDFRAVGDLLRTEQEPGTEEIDVFRKCPAKQDC